MRRLTVCNAGHPRPLLSRAAEELWEFLCQQEEAPCKAPRNIPLGLAGGADDDEFDVEMQPGDCLLSCTDALIESRDADGEMPGEDGLLRIVRLLGDVPAERLIETLLAEFAERCGKSKGGTAAAAGLQAGQHRRRDHPRAWAVLASPSAAAPRS